MTTSKAVVWLVVLIAALAVVTAGTGLFWDDGRGGSDPVSVTTVRGQTAELYGRGLYRYDTLFVGAGNRGTDAVTLFVGVPLLAVAVMLARRGSRRGAVLLVGALASFLYVSASYALGAVAYNGLFLAYVALFGATFFAFVLAYTSIGPRAISDRDAARLPRRWPAAFLFFGGAVTLVVWLMAPVAALIAGEPPDRLDTYTTLFTSALDLALIVPACFLSGALILRRAALGYLIGVALLGIIALLGPAFIAQTVSQVSAGVEFTPAEIVGPIGGFGLVALLAVSVWVILLRALPTPPPVPAAPRRAAPRVARASKEETEVDA
jgi:hypothetical protein